MKRLKCLVVALCVLFIGNSVALAEGEIGFELTTDFFGKYIWRGQNLSDDPVFEPALSISYGNLTAGIWGNMDLRNINGNSGDFSEVDYSLDYSNSLPGIEGVGYSIGTIFYDFPGTAVPDTTELYWGLNFDLPLSPSLTVYHDLNEADGTYISVALGHSIEKIVELTPEIPVGLEIGTSLGWGSRSYNKYYWGTEQSKLQDFTVSVAFPMEIAGWGLSPSLNYIMLVSDDIRDAPIVYGRGAGDFFFVGVSLSKSF